jgi:hypothetical protein
MFSVAVASGGREGEKRRPRGEEGARMITATTEE